MGRIETSDLKLVTSEPIVGHAKGKNLQLERNMALFSECMQRCGKKGLTELVLLEMRFLANGSRAVYDSDSG